MTAKYNTPSIEAIYEDSEDEQLEAMMGKEEDTPSEAARRQSRSWFDTNMTPNKANTGRERERPRRHRSSTTGSKHQSKSKPKTTTSRREIEMPRNADVPRLRRRRAMSNRSTSSASSSEEDDNVEDHRTVLATSRTRLTSPSVVSHLTALTNTTNKSSGSSGSNSTVTQDSVAKRSGLGKRLMIEKSPLSPAVPDAPDVFAFLEAPSVAPSIVGEDDDQSHHDSESESEGDSEEEGEDTSLMWPPTAPRTTYVQSSLPPHLATDQVSSSSSTTSGSFHGEDDFSSPTADMDTDRSTSPEQSVKDHDSEHDDLDAEDPVSVKIASQMAAAQQRQNRYESIPQLALPARGSSNIPSSPSSALTPRYQHQQSQRTPVTARQTLPLTGYELLASRLSCHTTDNEDGTMVKPMYRKFEALNHRILLHLQDEISELEEHLRRLDQADTQSRRTDRQIIPASRRAAAQAGGELQWHKQDVLGKIGYKLAQYNQALSSFNTTQSLNAPDPDDISAYRTYLQTENPIAEAETHFLDPTDDLVSVYSENIRAPMSNTSPSYAASNYSYSNDVHSPPSTFPSSPIPFELNTQQSMLPGLATAVAVSVLVPILTFNVIPQFIGRLTVTLLVAVGVVFALMQSGILKKGALLGKETITCAGIYGGVMIIIAGIM